MSPEDEEKPRKPGYRNPPRAGQFPKGVSGNPRGRPRKKVPQQTATSASFPTREAIRAEAKRLIPVNDASGRYEIETRHALIRSLMARGMGPNGSVFAQRTAVMMLLAEDERWHREQTERIERAQRYIVVCREANDKRVARGQRPIAFLPDPDDYVIDWMAGEVRIDGPIDEDGKAAAELVCAAQDLAYEMTVYHDEASHMCDADGHVTHMGAYLALYLVCRHHLWPRMRKPPAAYDEAISQGAALGWYGWETELRARCQALGLPFLPRKQGRPPLMIPMAKLGVRKPIIIPPMPPERRRRSRR